VEKIFDVYWQLSHPGAPSIPDNWPTNLSTALNLNHPARLKVNETNADVYLAVSKLFCVISISVCLSHLQENFVQQAEPWISMLC